LVIGVKFFGVRVQSEFQKSIFHRVNNYTRLAEDVFIFNLFIDNQN